MLRFQNQARKSSEAFHFRAGAFNFEPVLTYSFYHSDNQSWVDCDKMDDEGEELLAYRSHNRQTRSIRCPIALKDKPQSVVIRIQSEVGMF